MIKLRPAQERGHADHGWLNSYHTFSFANYYDPREVGYSSLLVINDDTVAAGKGFGAHPHDNMEIISIVLEGTLEHKDSMGNVARIQPGDIQRMSAGTGVTHSEYNPQPDKPVHFLQIWIEPNVQNPPPGYAQLHFPESDLQGKLRLVVSPDGRDGSVSIRQDASVYRTVLKEGDKVSYRPTAGRRVYVHVAQGDAVLNGQALSAGSGARVEQEPELTFEAPAWADVLVFDLP